MKLKRGSYAYIIGLLILAFDSVVSLTAFFFSLFSGEGEESPMLSHFGSRIAEGAFSSAASAVFSASITVFSVYVLWNALKKNSLKKPIRVVCVWLFIYAAVTVVTSILYTPQEDLFILLLLRCCKAVLPVTLALCMLRLSCSDLRFKIPSITLCPLCGLQTFFGYGFIRAFITTEKATPQQVRAFVSLLLICISAAIFFIGLAFFIAGSDADSKKHRPSAAQRLK